MSYELLKNGKASLVVEKSEFISYAFLVKNPAEVDYFLKILKKEHSKARHICYAYNINGNIKINDDGEPSGTSGKPILNVIEQNNIENIVIFVVRYFGGKLLGSGRLLRTYSEAAKLVIEESNLVEIIEENYYKVETDYTTVNILKAYLKNKHFNIINSTFNDNILIEFYAPLDFKEDIESLFNLKVKVIEKSVKKHRKE